MNDSAGGRRSPLGLFPRQPTPRLYDRVVEVLRPRHYSNIQAGAFRRDYSTIPAGAFCRDYSKIQAGASCRDYSRRTEEAYIYWIRRFILFHSGAHPRELAESDVTRFLTHLAVKESVAASTAAAGGADARGGRGSTEPLGWCPALGLHAPPNDSMIQ